MRREAKRQPREATKKFCWWPLAFGPSLTVGPPAVTRTTSLTTPRVGLNFLLLCGLPAFALANRSRRSALNSKHALESEKEGKGSEGRRAAVVCGPRCHASGYCAESRKSRENVARLLPPFPLPLPLLSLPPSRLQLRFFGRHTARQKADETSKWPRMGTERPATGRHGLVGRTRWTRRRR
jgi:hypothetical protein